MALNQDSNIEMSFNHFLGVRIDLIEILITLS